MQQADATGPKYATRYKRVENDPDDMVKYEQTLDTEYTAGADGENVIILLGLAGIGARIIQIERELKPIFRTDYSFNANAGQINLLNGVTMAAGETLFIIYAILITE